MTGIPVQAGKLHGTLMNASMVGSVRVTD